MLQVKIFTIFPDAFPGVLGFSICGRALEQKKWNLKTINIKDFAKDKHKTVDDTPFGGGAGMLMKADVLSDAIESELKAETSSPIIILTSARGSRFNQKIASKLSSINKTIYIICGRFEGVDQRFIDFYQINEVNLGNFVLFGGEVAAMAMLEAIIRLIPDILGNSETTKEESYAVGTEFENLMEYPQYTKPKTWNNLEVPEILFSGHHKNIAKWRMEEAKKITKKSLNLKFLDEG
jgi:tRNA (guanine37-N1)-methyltransferase